MSDKELCARCGKECKGHYVYTSRIDTKLICEDCWEKEKPKELIKRIAELEEENKNLKLEVELSRPLIEALEEDNLDLSYDRTDAIYDMAKELSEDWEDYKEQIAVLERALEMAIEEYNILKCKDYDCEFDDVSRCLECTKKYFIDQAEKDMEEIRRMK